ncbi:alpha-amylase family glycosyl hydrolase [Thermodesulfobacteriota bacterium]
MIELRDNPHIYEINLMTWLHDLSQRENQLITLKNIPVKEWRYLKELGMDLIWLMGMWERSSDSTARAQKEPNLVDGCRQILKDFEINDIIGSPYAIHDYRPDSIFGSFEDLSDLKNTLEEEGLGLILDFVPNHTACDHPWITEHPDRYIESSPTSTVCQKGFFAFGNPPNQRCFAHGKDPYFHPWTDTAQINYETHGTLEAMTEILIDLAQYCHGFRCDMAMLILKDIFLETWGPYLNKPADIEEFWPYAINRLKNSGVQCELMAEVYWGKDETLLDYGFDYVYDKHLYDLMNEGSIEKIKTYISMPPEKHQKMLRFLENHDEERAISVFGAERIRSAMLIHATLPGMRFWHHGQIEGRLHRVPVQLKRAPHEDSNMDLLTFSQALLKQVDHSVFHEGAFEIFSTHGWSDNESHVNLMAWGWEMKKERRLIVVNFSAHSAQGYVTLPKGWQVFPQSLVFRDPIKGDFFNRVPTEIDNEGLFIALEKGDFHFFIIEGNKR